MHIRTLNFFMIDFTIGSTYLSASESVSLYSCVWLISMMRFLWETILFDIRIFFSIYISLLNFLKYIIQSCNITQLKWYKKRFKLNHWKYLTKDYGKDLVRNRNQMRLSFISGKKRVRKSDKGNKLRGFRCIGSLKENRKIFFVDRHTALKS